MVTTNPQLAARRLSAVDVRRGIVVLALGLLIGTCYWFALPLLQDVFLPNLPGGAEGPWVVRPIVAFRFGAVAVLTAITGPLWLASFKRTWRGEDAITGARYDPLAGDAVKRVSYFFRAAVLLLVYAVALVFYLGAAVVVNEKGIEQRLPWGTRHYTFDDVASLEYIPHGMRSEKLRRNGPWYSVRFLSGQTISLGLDNERMTAETLASITEHLDDHTWMDWCVRSDAVKRH